MWTTTFVRRHIFRLTLGQIFTTRDFLSYGQRAAVDQALCRLVKRGVIIRLARGVFVREGSEMPSPIEIARKKAESFGRQFMRHCADLAKEKGLSPSGNARTTFAISGSSSSFRCGGEVIHLKGVGPRKIRLGDSKVGQAIRALWHGGKETLSPEQIMTAIRDFLRPERAELPQCSRWMPAWLNAQLVAGRFWVPVDWSASWQ